MGKRVSFEVFTLIDKVKNLMPEGIDTFQDWVDNLSNYEFGSYSLLCNKEYLDEEEVKYLRNMALSVFFKENDIDDMPLVEELIEDILSEFINCIVMIGLVNQGRLHVGGPIVLKDQMLSCTKVKSYSI